MRRTISHFSLSANFRRTAVQPKTTAHLRCIDLRNRARKTFSTFSRQIFHFICQIFRKNFDCHAVFKVRFLRVIYSFRPNTSQEQVAELFSKHGTIKNFKWISKEGSKMALIELSALEEAVMALISLHNYQLNGSYLRVNFAK